jgi:preprotein translocase subunit SecA
MLQYGLLETEDPDAYAAALATVGRECEEEHKRVVALGGLHILGTERHEARRIDNQLRGRAGRQGDPGSSRFYMALEDDLLRIFAGERLQRVMQKLGMEEGEAIEHSMVTRAIETAQKRVEAHNFEIRKHLLEYDDVMNTQRKIIYGERRKVLEGENLKEDILGMAEGVLDGFLALYTNPETYPEEWDLPGLTEAMGRVFGIEFAVPKAEVEDLTQALLKETLLERVHRTYEAKEQAVGAETMRGLERMVMLQVVDTQWKDHLLGMDHLKEGIGLRGYGQRDPLIEYKREAFEMFEAMEGRIKEQTVQYVFRIQFAPEGDARPALAARGAGDGGRLRYGPARQAAHAAPRPAPAPAARAASPRAAAPEAPIRLGKVGRNDPCSCGSGKKYKRCCGA